MTEQAMRVARAHPTWDAYEQVARERDEARAESDRMRAALGHLFEEYDYVMHDGSKTEPDWSGVSEAIKALRLTTPAPASDGIRQGGRLLGLWHARQKQIELQDRDNTRSADDWFELGEWLDAEIARLTAAE